MPSLNSLPLSLSEILEARGGPLRELEIWALLCQCAETLQDLIIKGEAVGDEAFRHIITPNSLMIRDNGTITLTDVTTDLSGSLYLAPELDSDKKQFVTDTAFEKMFVYSLGQTLQVASEFGLTENEVLSISYDLDSLLQAMSERNAAVRLGLIHILEACTLQARQHPHKSPHTYTLSRLYRTVLSSSASSSFRDSSYGSGGSRQSTLNAIPGRARRPRPHVRHRRENQKSRSRSRSRSHSPRRNRGGQNFMMSSQQRSGSPLKTNDAGIKMIADHRESKAPRFADTGPTSVTSSQFLNTSLSSTESDRSEFAARHFQTPPYAAAQSVQGLLGLRQGSPAYQKYIQLKERQIRLKQARLGQAPSVLNDVRSRLMTPTLLSNEMLDNMSENQSMASLMSYTIGTYKPNLHAQLGSVAALNYRQHAETDTGSQMSLMFSGGEYGHALRAEELPATHLPTETIVALPQQDHQKLQRRQQQQGDKQIQHQEPSLSQMQNLVSSSPADPPPETVTGPIRKQRDCYGPQYVFWNIKPSIRIAVPPPDNLKNVAQLRKLTVVHLTGQRLEVVLDPSTTGQQLFDTVIPHLDIDDFFFFGLTYMSESEHFFLDSETKLHKVAPEGWKEGPKGQAIHATFTLYVRIKFYPDSLTDFRHTNSYHILYLQLRRDVVEERVTCDLDTLVRLAGLAIQAEYGDHSQPIMEEHIFIPEHYFPGKAVRRIGAAAMADKALREHKNCTGIPESQAEIEYIKHVRHLPEYGIHFHKLFKNKSNTDTFMWVGLSKHSLVLAEPEPYGRSIVQDHPWNSILKISFNKRRFSIQPKVEVARGKPAKINFYTSSYRKGRYLLQFSTDQHRFQIRMRARPSNMETLSGNLAVQTADVAVGDDEIGEDVAEGRAPPPAYVDPSHQVLPYDEEEEADYSFWEGKPAPNLEHPLQYRNPPPYQPPRMAQILGCPHLLSEVDTVQLHASGTDLTSTDFDDHQLQMLLEMSSNSSSPDSALTSDRSEYEENSPPRSPPLPPSNFKFGRRIFEAILEKEGTHGIGLTIVGGEATSSLDLGIFVKSVVPGGPAERDGRILPGDRLIAIGGISLEGKQHHEAVAMIRDGGSQIALLVSQIRPPGTLKKRNFHNEQAEFEKKLRNSMLEYNNIENYQDSAVSKSDFPGLKNLLRFDDFVNNIPSSSDSDNIHHSQMIYPLAPPSTPSSPSHPFSQSFLYPGDGIKPANTINTENTTRNIKSNIQHQTNLTRLTAQQELRDVAEVYSIPQFSSHPEALTKYVWHQSEYDHNERNVDALQQLREEGEITFDCDRQIQDWYGDGIIHNRGEFSPQGLTKEDMEHLQLLGDIAALEANDSSSDSDFDTAIKKTIKGENHRTKDGRDVNPVSPVVNRMPTVYDTHLPDSVVTYEVILEKHGKSVGIITNKPDDLGFPKNGVYVKEILPGSSAEQGEIIVAGDRILEVAGQKVETSDSSTVQALLDSASDFVIVKVSRSLHKDVMVMGKSTFRNQNYPAQIQPPHQAYLDGKELPFTQNPNNALGTVSSERHPPSLKDQPKGVSISKLITSAPKETTKPLDGNLQIVPPPPPLTLTSRDSECNTQSDMDSDILDSSRSEHENIYSNANVSLGENLGVTSRVAHENNEASHLKAEEQENMVKNSNGERQLLNEGNGDVTRDSISLDGSCEFNEQLLLLQSTLDKVAGSEIISSNSVSQLGDSSSADSVMRSTRKLIEKQQKSLSRQSRLDSEVIQNRYGGHEVDNVTLCGSELASVYALSGTEATSLSSAGISRSTSEEASVTTVRNKSKESEDEYSLEPEILEISLKRDDLGFGFTIAGGSSTGGCYVKHLICDPAIADGRLRPGDKILKVNGQDVTSLSHVEAVILMRRLPDVANLQLLRYPSPIDASQKLIIAQAGMMRIELVRPDVTTSLGLSLMQGEVDGQYGIFVKRLRTGGIAHRNGLLEGDRIIQANGVSFIGISKRAALSVLREADEGVTLIITRSDRQKHLSNDDDDGGDNFDDDTGSITSYVSPRNQDVDVPVIMSPEWLRELPLLLEPKGRDDEFVSHLLQSLTDLVQAGEHNDEFKNLHHIKEAGPSHVGKLPENKTKNRYRNVLPYDENRVKLLNHTSDYINANHISMKVGDTELRYIACQGPIPESTSDFWAMVWQERINVIVMLTQVFEAGKVKCHTYWPQTKHAMISDDEALVITLIRSYELEDFTIVQVCIEQKETHLVREVTQIQYTSWPDHGVPETALPLLKLLQVVHLLEGGSPPIIHCSAGIGRTGSFIAIDTALATIEQGLELDLHGIVHNLRTQRHGMIQTTDQYLFCYTACMEALLTLTD